MIKVNLLREQITRPRKAIAAPTISRTGVLFAAILTILVVGMGGAWYYVRHQISTLSGSRERLVVENARIQQWKKEITEFEKLKKLREQRIRVIEELQQAQTGPVLLLNHVIQSMPKDNSVWLTTLDQRAERVQIVGFTLRNESVPDFMNNLLATGFFKTVDLELFEDAKDKDASRFSLVCTGARKALAE